VIVIWGIPGHLSAEFVRTEVLSMGASVFFLDQTATDQTELSVSVGEAVDAPDFVSGELCSGGDSLSLRDVTAVYIRAMDFRLVPSFASLPHDDRTRLHATALEELLVGWLEMSQARVVNRPSAMAPNNSKPYQAAQLRALGFSTPRTLVTTDPNAARWFLARHREVVYKSISSIPSIVSILRADDASALARMDDVANCPTQFQEYIPGPEYRIHTVGNQIFASRVISDADDYRHPDRNNTQTEILPSEVPSEVASLCIRASRNLNLSVAGFDVRRAPNGKWYCFEVNPAPDFGYYQLVTGQQISSAIARLLLTGTC
jgi:hypothetical protein